MTLLPTRAPAQDPSLEYQVKAEFIERFTRFIDWPGYVFADPNVPFVICFGGQDPLAKYLAELARSRQVKGRRIVLRHIDDPAAVGGCHILFISKGEERRLRLFLSNTTGKPILTIGDTHGYDEAGVLINLYLEGGGHVRFRINVSEVVRSGLAFSSKLMKLAGPVSTEPRK